MRWEAGGVRTLTITMDGVPIISWNEYHHPVTGGPLHERRGGDRIPAILSASVFARFHKEIGAPLKPMLAHRATGLPGSIAGAF
jgi:hypothetical protein